MKPLIDLHGEPKNWRAAQDIYFDALRDLPEQMLDLAVRRCICNNTFFPKPSELREAIRDEMRECYRRHQEENRAAVAALPERHRIMLVENDPAG